MALFVLPALLFVALLGAAVANDSGPPGRGDEAPAFEAQLLTGDGTLALDDLRGKPVVLNFWASWCVPCKDEAPMLREAEQRYGDTVTFVGIDIRDARSDAVRFVDEQGLDYMHVRDEDGAIYEAFGLTGQPETFFLDEEGKILEHVPGPLFRDTLFQLLDSLTARSV